eukprot:9475195-Pyramimonas_sp.AAC.1
MRTAVDGWCSSSKSERTEQSGRSTVNSRQAGDERALGPLVALLGRFRLGCGHTKTGRRILHKAGQSRRAPVGVQTSGITANNPMSRRAQ